MLTQQEQIAQILADILPKLQGLEFFSALTYGNVFFWFSILILSLPPFFVVVASYLANPTTVLPNAVATEVNRVQREGIIVNV